MPGSLTAADLVAALRILPELAPLRLRKAFGRRAVAEAVVDGTRFWILVVEMPDDDLTANGHHPRRR